MKILEASDNFFNKAGIIAWDRKRSTLIKTFAKNIFFVAILGPILCTFSGLFIYYHGIDDFEKFIGSLVVLSEASMSCCKYLYLKSHSREIMSFIASFRDLVDRGLYIYFHFD